jgi:ribonuclease HI
VQNPTAVWRYTHQSTAAAATLAKHPIGWYKCNVDAEFHNEANKTSVGWCLRDHMEMFVLVGIHWKDGWYSIAEGESIVLLQAMKEMELKGITQVIFKTDSKCVVLLIYYVLEPWSLTRLFIILIMY